MVNVMLLVAGVLAVVAVLMVSYGLRHFLHDLDGFEGIADEQDLETGAVITDVNVEEAGNEANRAISSKDHGAVGRFGDDKH